MTMMFQYSQVKELDLSTFDMNNVQFIHKMLWSDHIESMIVKTHEDKNKLETSVGFFSDITITIKD